jgi:hypothetical protein
VVCRLTQLPEIRVRSVRLEALQKSEQQWVEEIAHLLELNRIRNKLAHQLPSGPGHHADVKK